MRKCLAILCLGSFSALPSLALAEPSLYGTVHVSINKIKELNDGELRMDSHSSAIGIKGSEDLESGLKLIYKAEFEYDTTECAANTAEPDCKEGSALRDRDQWIGLANEQYGVLRLGVISTGYKSSGASVDPLYRTIFEGRGFLGTQSRLHGEAGPDGGRSTNTVRYDSAGTEGVRWVATYALAEQQSNTMSLGVQYQQNGLQAHIDYLKSEQLDANAYKIGGQYDTGKGFLFGGQYERGDDALFRNGVEQVYMLHGGYIAGNTAWILTLGGHVDYSFSTAVVADHKLGANTDMYAGFGIRNYDKNAPHKDDNIFAIGLRHNF